MEAYHQAIHGAPSPGDKPAPKTWRWLCSIYMASPEYDELSLSTQSQQRNVLKTTWLEPIAPDAERKVGDMPIARFDRKVVRMLRDRKKATPDAANYRIKVISAVWSWAIEAEHAEVNPAQGMKRLKSANPDGHHTWTVDEVRQYERRHPIGTKARLALAIFAFTGVRISDAARLGRPNVEGDDIAWTEAKGQDRHPKERAIPMLPELKAVIDATTLLGTSTWLVTQYGRPFTVKGLGNKFRDWCDEAGLNHCTAHGLRKAGAAIAAENGATDRQLMAIFGWETAQQVTRYTRQADRRRLAKSAMGLVVSKEG